ncbi:hypothetical protein EX895_003500 [Sporisorium graminicola]|uniref:RING-type domain-containing protein n=1 Tax=Sporisorium graminicola TaxID=280036 RepID=A0A4U7KTQ9_9BASI|nr:hypothetical protein EX895_003500 [Sporisorium graminicola]TKY87486.1 hypothetical protein EX895_003500 [Sporisorium graminicola]
MGNAQSRRQRDAEQEPPGDDSSSSQTASYPRSGSANNRLTASEDAVAENLVRKRRRHSSSDGLETESAHRLSRRRRASPLPDSAPEPEAQQRSAEASQTAMDVDTVEAPVISFTRSATTGATAPIVNQAHPPPSDLQQRFAVVQSRADASPGDEGGATPPPHLDVLRDERERARRQILEALGAAASSATSAQQSNDGTTATTTSSTQAATSATTSSAIPSDAWASATVAALLGSAAAAPDADALAHAPQVNAASSRAAEPVSPIPASSPALSSTSHSHSQQPQAQQQQHRPQPPRSQAVRVPLQAAMISGTSMVVQGALVARILNDRPASSASSSSESGTTGQATRNETSTTPPPPPPSGDVSTGTESDSGVPGATVEGDTMRGAVTLEEQAVMLSRILGIAAAATAASLLNASEAQHVDPSLLQTSLRRPFERMNQAPNERNERWLADWQRNGSHTRPPSNSSNAESTRRQASNHPFAGMPRHRDGITRLARQMQQYIDGHDSPEPWQSVDTGDRTNEASTGTENIPAAAAPTAPTADGPTAGYETARQQEIIARLLRAAERDAASRRLTRVRSANHSTSSTAATPSDRARSSSFGAAGPLAASTQPDAPRRGLSSLIRSTIGSFLHPSRLLSGRSSHSTERPSSDSHQDGWTSASAGRGDPGPTAAPPSDFSLGPNDVAGPLRQVRNGILPDGVPGSFGSFLNHLVNDLMEAVQLMRPSNEASNERAEVQTPQTTDYFEHAARSQATSGAEVLDGETSASDPQAQPAQASDSQAGPGEEDLETQARRQRDFQNGNLSFFRLFRFDPVSPSQLVPCIVVGVRSLSVMERFGEEMNPAPGPGREFNGSRQQTSRPTTLESARSSATPQRQRAHSVGAQASTPSQSQSTDASGEDLPASRFMLFVSGGRYPPNHPLLTSNPTTAGRDLMTLMDLLSTMQAMQHKPSTVTQAEIDASDLVKIKGFEVAAKVQDGKITENMAERCLVCLEDWQDDDDCRVLACRHAFHTTCVDRWMTSSSNTCPMCRRQGVSKDGHQAGAETADSRRAAQT